MSERAVPSETSTRPERRVAINSGLLLLAFGFQALISLVLVGIVARYLGQAGLGRYGPYVRHGTTYRKLGGPERVFDVTLEEALKLLARKRAPRRRPRRRRRR